MLNTRNKNETGEMPMRHDIRYVTDQDLYYFNEGTHYQLYDKFGAHVINRDGQSGTNFAVWAPSAEQVSVIGEFNQWNKNSHQLSTRGESGVWEGFVPGLGTGQVYKYHIKSRYGGYNVDKADPFMFFGEQAPQKGSITWNLDYTWGDEGWMQSRKKANSSKSPMSIYEVHIGSWRRKPEDRNRSLTYRELAPLLADYVKELGYTHVEFMPIMEHPFYGSWGYQVTGFFAPTSRYGTPADFMYLVDYLHQNEIGVILDWVPSHFPTDEHGLKFFDGTHLYEHADDRQGMHKDWNTAIFNYGRNEVRSFLMSNAMFWLDKYHIDGLRVDAVASMLYLDYSRKEGEWIPNQYGGRENLEAMSFLQRLNEDVYSKFPDVQTIAEESTAWPMVSKPTYLGGLGFGMKWDMGWMHDTLKYFALDPIYRKFHHNTLTFRMVYAFTENFVLSLSHDEVVYGKGSLLNKMPGDDWRKFANLRLLFGYQFTQPGKKLLFMGGDIAQWNEWNHETSVDWHLLENYSNKGVQRCVSDLNRIYQKCAALHELDFDPNGFQWLDGNDSDQSVLSFLRKDSKGNSVVVICNFTPMPRDNYRVGVPSGGYWQEVFNSDAREYGGSGVGNMGGVASRPIRYHGFLQSINLTLPPLGILILQKEAA